ncbi:transcriptional regulator [Achromobacter denitrificans]|uniref:Helix-turn-helix domain-containing protein n=1 Tax=Achromobacter denitrificans TaxID=32002 RepID=A0A6N0JN03_ACHDE|nr:YdaS family helix-turn-helix protein [Achromobacter denitrificans]QKQ48513.1 helix-turn-helix domain-containing protein [Achromobacter denitrificans]
MKLLDYLNSLRTADQAAFAERCGTSVAYLRQVAYGNRRCGEALAISIDRESGRQVRMQALRPDVDWNHLARAAAHA